MSGKKKTNKHKHFRRDGVRDKQAPSLGQMGPLPGTKWDPSLGNRPFSAEFHSKFAILSSLSLGRVGACPWDDCPTRAVRKMFMCFQILFIGFFAPKSWASVDVLGEAHQLVRPRGSQVQTDGCTPKGGFASKRVGIQQSAPAQGQLQLKWTSDATSLRRQCCRASVW